MTVAPGNAIRKENKRVYFQMYNVPHNQGLFNPNVALVDVHIFFCKMKITQKIQWKKTDAQQLKDEWQAPDDSMR